MCLSVGLPACPTYRSVVTAGAVAGLKKSG
jgi:hypothetical protein